jgi:UDP-GlcNAc:undecaprenyl-phosphate GlcNAc-1-phosphate transferase
VAASVVFFSGLRIGVVVEHPLSIWLEYPLTVFWLLLTSNALNLIDGLDGLCAGMGLLSTLALFTAAVLHGNYALAKVTFPLAGALLGFLCYNLNPATVFLGDSGALLIGFLLGCYGMIWTQKSSTLLSMLVPLLALSIPLLDVSLAVLRRFLRNQPIFSADRGHIHHRLLDRGLTPRQAVWVLYVVAALAASLALLASSTISRPYQTLVVLLFCLAAWAGVQKLGYPEFDIAGRLLFRGEFQRTMDSRLKVEALTTALEQAATDDQWWEALVKARTTLDLVVLRWSGDEGIRESITPGRVSAWSLRIPVSSTDAIEIEGGFPSGGQPFDLISFAAMVNRTFRLERPSHRSPQAGKVAAALP